MFSPTCTLWTTGCSMMLLNFSLRPGTATSLNVAFACFEGVSLIFNSKCLLNHLSLVCLHMERAVLMRRFLALAFPVCSQLPAWFHTTRRSASNAPAHQTYRSNHCVFCRIVFGKVSCGPLLDCTSSSTTKRVAPTKRDMFFAVRCSADVCLKLQLVCTKFASVDTDTSVNVAMALMRMHRSLS